MFGMSVAPTAASAGTVNIGLKLVVVPFIAPVAAAELAEASCAAEVRPIAPPDEIEVVSTSGLSALAKGVKDTV